MKCTGGLKDVNGFHALATKQINYLRTQIDLINPKLVVLCLSKSAYLRELLFPDTVGQWKNSGYDVEVAILPDKKLVDFYHPSARNAPAASYGQLQNIIRSIF